MRLRRARGARQLRLRSIAGQTANRSIWVCETGSSALCYPCIHPLPPGVGKKALQMVSGVEVQPVVHRLIQPRDRARLRHILREG
jgi:hypothetical protein